MELLITDEIFAAFLICEIKPCLIFSNVVQAHTEFTLWHQRIRHNFRQSCAKQLLNSRTDEAPSNISVSDALERSDCRLVINCIAQTQRIKTHLHALEFLQHLDNMRPDYFVPYRFVSRHKIIKQDRLLLGFDAFVLSETIGIVPPYGKIIFGDKHLAAKVKLVELIPLIQKIVDRIEVQAIQTEPIHPVLNRYCPECEYQAYCRQKAIEVDDLSLLSGMTEKEWKRQRAKGIFSITQLSYTFRPRKKPKHLDSKPEKHSHALKALAIREQRVYVVGESKLYSQRTPIYLDIEGDPDRKFYYLIGLRIKRDASVVCHSFWANDISEEKEIWIAFLRTVAKIPNPQIFHYGSYESKFLKQMKKRYPETVEDTDFVERLMSQSVNVLSIIYAHVYFPTYSNRLKEIAYYLGYRWSFENASGLDALVWRCKWESTKDEDLKQKLCLYNIEDCEALERVAEFVDHLWSKEASKVEPDNLQITYADSMPRDRLLTFGNNNFLVPQLQQINQAAYWDRQQKLRITSTRDSGPLVRKGQTGTRPYLDVDCEVYCNLPDSCPICQSQQLLKRQRRNKIVYDLNFGINSIERRILRYIFYKCSCNECGYTFTSRDNLSCDNKIGLNILAYIVYQIIELHISQVAVTKHLNLLFHFGLDRSTVNRQKSRASRIYQETYDGIVKSVIDGPLIHVDETRVSIRGKRGYVWVIANSENVAYFFTETRSGDKVHELLRQFKGVLVSDFYSTYDSIDCSQQKCLIHLMRELNDNHLSQPFNEELGELIQSFADLLQPIIKTIDEYGLRTYYLQKHKVRVDQFFDRLFSRSYRTELAMKNKQRFEKNRNKLFTFLDYDDVPWNNNNAEHAVKAFATLRKIIGGLCTKKGIHDYLILLSICETCGYRGVDFLNFLQSNSRDIEEFEKNC